MSTQTLSDHRLLDIPLSKIRPNPDNPRGPVDSQEAQAMAESLREAGQKTEIRVRPMTDEEKAQYTPYEYLLIGGHVRLAGAKLAGLESLRAVVVEKGTPDEEFDDVCIDNRLTDMGWWKWDLAIEKRMNLPPKITQERLAARWKLSQAKISTAVKVTKFLNPASRELVDQNLKQPGVNYQPLITKNKGFLITESILLILADLEDPQKVEAALRKVLDDQMTEAQVRQMVKSHLEPSPQAGEAGSAVPGVASPNASLGAPASPRLNDVLSSVAGSLLTKKAKQAHNQVLNRIVPRFSKIFGLATKLVEWLGVKHKVWATVIAFFLVMFLGSFVISNVKSFLLRHLHLPNGPQVIGQALVVPGQGTEFTTSQTGPGIPVTVYQAAPPVQKHASSKPAGSAPAVRPQAERRALVVPTGENPVGTASPRLNAVKPLAEGGTIPAWTQADIPLASEFAGKFFGVSYSNWGDNLAYLKTHVVEDYGPTLAQQYFPDSLEKEFVDNQLVQYFSPSQPARVVSGEGNSAQLRVEGKVITQSLKGRIPQTLYEKSVALLMDYRKVEGFGSRIEKVSVVDPGTPTAQGEDVGKSIGDGVKDYSNAVNTVDDGLSATDKAKKLLGF